MYTCTFCYTSPANCYCYGGLCCHGKHWQVVTSGHDNKIEVLHSMEHATVREEGERRERERQRVCVCVYVREIEEEEEPKSRNNGTSSYYSSKMLSQNTTHCATLLSPPPPHNLNVLNFLYAPDPDTAMIRY